MLTPVILEKLLRESIKESAEKEINPYWINRLVSIFIEKAGKAEGQKWESMLDARNFKEEH